MSKLYKKAKTIDIAQYAFGGLGSNIAFFLTMSYLNYFYTDIFVISPLAVANLMLFSRLIDAFTDPLMGMIADRTNTKMGKFRPYIIFGAPFLGFITYLMFTTPNFSETSKVIYAWATYIGYSLISTIVNIPYHAATPIMSEDPDQRTIIVSAKQGMGVVAQLIIMVFTLPLVNMFGGGTLGWSRYGMLIGVIITISFIICGLGIKDYDIQQTEVSATESMNFKEQLSFLFKNKPMMLLLTSFCMSVFAMSISNAANIYFFKYVLNRFDLVPTVALVSLSMTVLSVFLIPILAKKFGKKPLYLVSLGLTIIPYVIMYFFPRLPIPILFFLMGTVGLTGQISGTVGWSMSIDCIDYGEAEFGVRSNAILTSSITFVNKFGGALGGFFAGWLLALVNFTPIDVQPASVISMIIFMRFGFPVITYIVSFIAMNKYPIDNAKYDEIRQVLDSK